MPDDIRAENFRPQNGVVSSVELVQLGAVDSIFFSRTFFPRAIRQSSPNMHREVWNLLEEPNSRLVNIQIFRGGAKTTLLRCYTAKRIAYGLAHTILYIGKSEGHAARSIKWLRTQIEHNKQFVQTFNLRAGKKWSDTEAEIWQGTDEFPVWIVGMGITGSVRGINMDNFRPDLIVVDDVIDEENSSTPDGRKKISDLIYGALKESLAPASEAPDAKMVMLQTPLNREDASTVALTDPEWKSAKFGCWTEETKDFPTEQQESVWPSRWTSAELRKEKEASFARNKVSLWMREKECRIISPETSAFRPEWLKYYDLEPEGLTTVLAIDPVPPPTDLQISKGLRGKDYECLAVVGRRGADYYLLEYSAHRGHEPNWTIAEFFRLCLKYRPRKVVVETIAYQKTLSWLLKKAMENQRRYWVIEDFADRRKKFDRIVDGLSGPTAEGHFYVKPEQVEFIQQFTEYPDVAYDDIVEAVAVATQKVSELIYDDTGDYDAYLYEEDNMKTLTYQRGCP